jgi:cytochrome c553
MARLSFTKSSILEQKLMNSNTVWSILAAVFLALGAAQATQAAGDAEAGKKNFYTCGGCHSIEGYSNAFPTYPVPRIGGQHAQSVLSALKAYQEGTRKHGSMQGNATGWSDKELEDIAAFVAKKKLSIETNAIEGNPAAGKEKVDVCSGCHGEDGNSADPNFPRLAGQYEGYLVHALKTYKKGARVNAIMTGMVSSLSDKDIKDISAYYASQKRGLTTISNSD